MLAMAFVVFTYHTKDINPMWSQDMSALFAAFAAAGGVLFKEQGRTLNSGLGMVYIYIFALPVHSASFLGWYKPQKYLKRISRSPAQGFFLSRICIHGIFAV